MNNLQFESVLFNFHDVINDDLVTVPVFCAATMADKQ